MNWKVFLNVCSIRSGVSIRANPKNKTQVLLTCLNLCNQKIHAKWNAFSFRLMANTVCQGECNFFAMNCPGELSHSTIFTFKYFLETFAQYVAYLICWPHIRSRLCDVRLVERAGPLPPYIVYTRRTLKTMRTIEDKNIPSRGWQVFNQVVIKLQSTAEHETEIISCFFT